MADDDEAICRLLSLLNRMAVDDKEGHHVAEEGLLQIGISLAAVMAARCEQPELARSRILDGLRVVNLPQALALWRRVSDPYHEDRNH